MKDKFVDEVLALLNDKLLVAPNMSQIRENGAVVKEYVANGIHRNDETDEYCMQTRKLGLYMPLSATLPKNLNLGKGLPERVVIDYDDFPKEFFNLLCFTKSVGLEKLDSSERKMAIKRLKTEKMPEPETSIDTVDNYYVRVPQQFKDKVSVANYPYEEVIKGFARDSFEKFCQEKIKTITARLSTRAKNCFKLSDAQFEEIKKDYKKFVKSFDAIEVSYVSSAPMVSGFKGFDDLKDGEYATFDVALYKIPDKTKEDKEIKSLINRKVAEKKAQVNKAVEQHKNK